MQLGEMQLALELPRALASIGKLVCLLWQPSVDAGPIGRKKAALRHPHTFPPQAPLYCRTSTATSSYSLSTLLATAHPTLPTCELATEPQSERKRARHLENGNAGLCLQQKF